MNLLSEIKVHKQKEVEERKALKPIKLLERSLFYESPVVSLVDYLERDDKLGIIAEIKRKSPSTGTLNEYLDLEQLSIGYMQAGASALSVLTDTHFFGGSENDLMAARRFNYCPILRKDFIIDPYQVIEAKSIGSDCVLLIAAILSPTQCRMLAQLAQEIGLEVLLEVHSKKEIDSHCNPYLNLIGVNNRDLDTFQTRIDVSLELAKHLPTEIPRISESGISEAGQIDQLKRKGYSGFLIGGFFMKHSHPANACQKLIADYQNHYPQ